MEHALLRLPEDVWQEVLSTTIKTRKPDAGPLPRTGLKAFDDYERELWEEIEREGVLDG